MKVCSLASRQTVTSVLHGTRLLIQDLINVLLHEDSKLFRHIKHSHLMLYKMWTLSLPRVASNEGIKKRQKKYNNEFCGSHSGAGE